jgi:hypothetical protein
VAAVVEIQEQFVDPVEPYKDRQTLLRKASVAKAETVYPVQAVG